MRQEIVENHKLGPNLVPSGGSTRGLGLLIDWQDGPLGRGAGRQEPNGAFVEGVIAAAIGRLEWYQTSKFHCSYNAEAITHLRAALDALDRRTKDREARDVEGLHEE